jgi:integrase
MARTTTPLNELAIKKAIRTAKAENKTVKSFDGGGLFLLVDKSGNAGWRFKYRINDKEKLISFGVYPDFSLSDARNRRTEARELLTKDIDPSLARKQLKAERVNKQKNTFRCIAEEWLSKRTDLLPVTSDRIKRCLKQDIFPAIEDIPVSLITPQLLLEKVLRPMEKRGVIYSAHRVRTIVSQTLRYGVACGLLERDSTVDLRGALPPIQRQHLAAITDPQKVGALLRAIKGFDGTAAVRAALQLHPYVVTRPGELRHMEWVEVNLETATWEIPAGKMKMKNPHIVPLSRQAVDILKKLQPLTGAGRYAFPSIRSTAKPISDNTLNAALRRLGYSGDEMTSHGWRATFRTLTDEQLGIRVEYAEQQLAHLVKDPLGRAYNRTKHLEQRRKMMQTWADYLDRLAADTEGKVIQIRKTGGRS